MAGPRTGAFKEREVTSGEAAVATAAGAVIGSSSGMATNFGKATNVIERRGDHNKNLDEPFLPRANKPKVFVSEPKVFVPSATTRTAASIMQEFKNRPHVAAPVGTGRFATNNHLEMIEAASALEIMHMPNHNHSARIQNFNMYEDYIKRKIPEVS